MKNGCILIRLKPGKVKETLESVRKIEGVVTAFLVFGRYDLVAFVETEELEELFDIAVEINSLEGTESTETLPEAP
ncbi:MAG: Lrp/AsnC ligand binding domain-containing protein [Candidatus Wukongarchaeota archaeon]|nr:Lrp/AsnC ligand binding domain-containing protein [Candidatus Wukongarchaeota archaeon]